MSSPSPAYKVASIPALDDVDLDAAETADTFPTSTSPPGLTGLGLKVTKGRARAGSVSTNAAAAAAAASTGAPSAASKVRAAAAMWETKDPVTTSTGGASTGGTRQPVRRQQSAASSTSPRNAAAARFQGAAAAAATGGAAGASASSDRSSPRSPLTTPKLTSPTLSPSPRSPPTAFKGMSSGSGVKPLRLGRSTSTSSVSSAGSSRGRASPAAAPALKESPKSPAKSIKEELSKVSLHDDDDDDDDLDLDEFHDEPLHDEPLHDEPLHDEPVVAAAKIASPELAPKIPSPEVHTSHVANEDDESAPLDFGRAAPYASPEPTPSSLVTPASPNGSHSNYSASPVPSHRDLEPSSSDALHAHTTLSPQVERVGLSPDRPRFDLSPASVYEDFSPVSAKTDLLADGGKVDLLPASEKIDVSPLSSSALEFHTGVEQEAHHETARDITHEHVEAESELLDDVDLSPPPAPLSKLSLSRPTTPDHGQLSPSLETPRAYGGGPTATITPASPVGPGASADTSDDHITTPTTPQTAGGLVVNDFEEVHLSPAKHDPPSATTTPVRTMSSLFSRVLDYTTPPPPPKDKEVAPIAATPTTPGEEKELPTPKDLDDVSKEPSNNKDSGSSFSASRSRFFTSATSAFGSFNLPSVSLPSMPTLPRGNSTHSDTSPPSELAVPSPAALSPVPIGSAATSPGGASTWRSTMTNFLATRAASSPSSSPISKPSLPPRTSSANATVAAAAATAAAGTTVTAASLLLHRLDSPTSARDRRHSREVGGSDKLREGFERVRGEMEGAARDIRRQRARGSEIDIVNVDWVFWGAVVQDYEEIARTQPKELSRAIQQGIPPVIRGPIWQLMSSSKSAELEETYKALLKLHSQHEKAIRKDITRTFPTHKFFQHTGQGQDGLFMVVKAYSLYDQDVGYTQGIAFIVAALLLNMPDEEAFCVLVRLMDSYNLRSHYLADMPGLQLRLYQFDRLLEECLPLLSNHLVRKGVKSSMYASQWLMTLFSYRFPLSLVYRVLDIVLAEGIEAIFRFSLALLRKSEDQLLQLGFEDILNCLQGDLFEAYRAESGEGDAVEGSREGEEEWRTNDFVRDAYEVHITPLMLDQYEAEWNEKCRVQMAHARETDQLRSANRHLSAQVKTLESSLATMNNEHVELVRQLVLAKIAREDMETELVKYKSLCASLSQNVHGDIDGALASNPSGLSLASLRSAAATASVASNHSSPAMGPHHEAGNLVPSPTGQSAASVSSSPGGPSV